MGLSLGCVNSLPTARVSQEAGFTQPRAHLLAYPCIYATFFPQVQLKAFDSKSEALLEGQEAADELKRGGATVNDI